MGVAAEGPRTSRKLGILGLFLAMILLPFGWLSGASLIVNIGRVCLGAGVIGIIDFFLADPGKYKEFREHLSEEEKEILKEIAEIKRKTNTVWGV